MLCYFGREIYENGRSIVIKTVHLPFIYSFERKIKDEHFVNAFNRGI